ncbi:MAG: hypothetical protein V1921_05350 [Candidatus Altiarchaeota archaeon]
MNVEKQNDKRPEANIPLRQVSKDKKLIRYMSADAFFAPESSFKAGEYCVDNCVMVAPYAKIRGGIVDIGDYSNIQDHVIVGSDSTETAVIGKNVSLAHQAKILGTHIHIGDGTLIDMKAELDEATVGNNCVIEPGAVLRGVYIEDGMYVKAKTNIDGDMGLRDAIRKGLAGFIRDEPDYPYKNLNARVVHVNKELARGYNRLKEEGADLSTPVLQNPKVGWTTHRVSMPVAKAVAERGVKIIGPAMLEGDVEFGEGSVIRVDEGGIEEGTPISIGDGTVTGRNFVAHALETSKKGNLIEKNTVEVGGRRYSIFIGEDVTMRDDVQIHGPAAVLYGCELGHNVLIFKGFLEEGVRVGRDSLIMARVGKNSVIGDDVFVGVDVPLATKIPSGARIRTVKDLEKLRG